MIIFYKTKILIGLLLFLSIFTVNFSSLDAAGRTEKPHTYVQINQAHHVGTILDSTAWIFDSESQQYNRTRSKLGFPTLYPNFLSNFMIGVIFIPGIGVELEYTSYDLFIDEINGNIATNADFTYSNIKIEYVFFNIRKDIFSYKNLYSFYKIGLGFTQPNISNSNREGGQELEASLQASIGMYYPLNDFLDIEVYYKSLANYSRRRPLRTLGYDLKNQYIESSVNWSLRFKFHSLVGR